MKSYDYNFRFHLLFSLIVLTIAAIIIPACASGGNTQTIQDSSVTVNDRNDKIFSFYDSTNGSNNFWQATFNNGNLVKLYKNGNKIPVDEIEKYSNLVKENLNDIDSNFADADSNGYHFHFKMKHFNKNFMPPKNLLSDIDINFNDEKLAEEMANLDKNLTKLKHIKIDVNFNPEELKDQMKVMKEHLEKMDLPKKIKIDFDTDKFNDKMEKLSEDIANKKLDMENFKINMSDLKDNLKDLKVKMKNLDKSLKTLDDFVNDLKSEMVKDKLIDNIDEKADINISGDKMTVNGKQVPNNLLDKYKEIYKKHFGRNLNKDSLLHFN